MSGAGAADTTLTPEDYRGFKLAIVASFFIVKLYKKCYNCIIGG